MNRKSRAKSSSLFLLELILAILFFSIASAVCVQIFVKSHLLSADAQALNLAVSECSGAAEVIYASEDADDAVDKLSEIYSREDISPGAYNGAYDSEAPALKAYYDEDLQPCRKKDGCYELVISLSQENTMLSADIEMLDTEDGDSVYRLDVKHHIQKEAADE